MYSYVFLIFEQIWDNIESPEYIKVQIYFIYKIIGNKLKIPYNQLTLNIISLSDNKSSQQN